MKKLILSSAIAIAMGMSAGAFAASDMDYQGGSVAGTLGGSSAVSGGAGTSGGVAIQGSQAQSFNDTGATATEVNGPNSVDVEASTHSIGATSQDSFSSTTGTANGATGALTAQGGTADASASGSTADGDFGTNGVDYIGVTGGVGGAQAESSTTAGSGAITAATGNGSASYDTIGAAGNVTTAHTDITADVNAGARTTDLDMNSNAVSVGGNYNSVSGTQSGSAFGLAASGATQDSSASAGNIGGALFGQVGGGEIVVGAGVAANGSAVGQESAGLVFGVNNGDAVSTTATGAANFSGANLGSITTADNSSTTVTTGGYEVGTSGALTSNSNTPGDSFNANLGGNAGELGGGGAIAGFTTLP